MATNLTIESPNFDKINSEAGPFTADAINLLWASLNDTRAVERRDFRRAQERLEPKVLVMSPSASVDNLDLQGASVLSFEGSSAQNVTGFRAPESNTSRVIICQVSGSATITFKHNVTSETTNRLILSTAADTTRATNQGIIFVYLASRWREASRSS